MKVDLVLKDVTEAEQDLAQHLVRFAERHATEHDLYHTGHAVARQCRQHLELLEPFTARYDAPGPDSSVRSPGLLERVRHGASDALGRSEPAALVLVHDMRDLYLAVQDAELAWVVLLQVARAVRDAELLETATTCHEAAAMRGKWLCTRIKESVPQIYST
jgi:hypothetical protein